MCFLTSAKAGALAAMVTFALTACDSTDETDANMPSAANYSSAQRTDGPMTTRVKEYKSTNQLQADSTLVVVATGTGKVARDEAEGPGDPVTVTTAVIDEVISGSGYKPGDEISIFAEGFRDENGQLGQEKIVANMAYVLYLTPFRKTADGQVFAVTGYLAGLYEEVATDQFGRVDPESPELPRGLDLSGTKIREVR